MLFRKIFMSTAAVIFILYGTALSDEYTGYKDKKMSIALKLGTNYNVDSDYTDFWEPNLSWSKFWPREVSYEYKLFKKIGVELALGYTTMDGESRNISAMPAAAGETKDDRAKIDLANIYFSPSAKLYFPVMDSFSVYGGIGPDFYNSRGDLLYQRTGDSTYSTKSNVSKFGYGAHGMIGVEYYFFKNPTKHNLYNWPVSIELQYKYTWATVEKIDKKLIDDMNEELGASYPYNDINVGGHMVTIGVRWHIY
ncbi:MAG: outer membrane beta-barrel protein [Deltaproteobacteria bacterium]|nr:outer membrane beta-barrel protein [Deltaproteobacteria bacterium]